MNITSIISTIVKAILLTIALLFITYFIDSFLIKMNIHIPYLDGPSVRYILLCFILVNISILFRNIKKKI